MKLKKLLILPLFIMVLVVGFSFNIKTKASTEERIYYDMTPTKDIMIYSTFNPMNRSDYQENGNLIYFGTELLNYSYYEPGGYFNLIYPNTDHIVNSYLSSELFCYYITCRNEEYWEYTLFVFSWHNYYEDSPNWTQLGRFDFSLGGNFDTLSTSIFCSNLVYYLPRNNNIKLTLVREQWALTIGNYLNGLGNLVTQGDNDIYELGYESGYRDGYSQGEENIENLPLSFLTPILSFFSTFFAIKLAPGLSIGSIVLIPLILGVIGLVLYFWRKD